MALKNDGTVLAWSSNDHGQLGDGTNTNSSAPVQVKDPSGYLSGVNAIAAASSHSLTLKNDDTI